MMNDQQAEEQVAREWDWAEFQAAYKGWLDFTARAFAKTTEAIVQFGPFGLISPAIYKDIPVAAHRATQPAPAPVVSQVADLRAEPVPEGYPMPTSPQEGLTVIAPPAEEAPSAENADHKRVCVNGGWPRRAYTGLVNMFAQVGYAAGYVVGGVIAIPMSLVLIPIFGRMTDKKYGNAEEYIANYLNEIRGRVVNWSLAGALITAGAAIGYVLLTLGTIGIAVAMPTIIPAAIVVGTLTGLAKLLGSYHDYQQREIRLARAEEICARLKGMRVLTRHAIDENSTMKEQFDSGKAVVVEVLPPSVEGSTVDNYRRYKDAYVLRIRDVITRIRFCLRTGAPADGLLAELPDDMPSAICEISAHANVSQRIEWVQDQLGGVYAPRRGSEYQGHGPAFLGLYERVEGLEARMRAPQLDGAGPRVAASPTHPSF